MLAQSLPSHNGRALAARAHPAEATEARFDHGVGQTLKNRLLKQLPDGSANTGPVFRSPPKASAYFSSASSRALKPGNACALNLRVFDSAPIKIIHTQDIPQLVTDFLENVESNPAISPLPQRKQSGIPSADNNVCLTDWQIPPRTHEEIYNDRLKNTRAMINTVKRFPKPDLVMAYYVDNSPIGILILKKMASNRPAKINVLATHPLSEGAGAALIERAVAQAVAWDKKGCLLQLMSLNGDSTKAYEALGFVAVSHDNSWDLTLTPQDSKKWSLQGDQWQLQNKDTNKKYIG
ncbi:hypothetical protein [Actimicrobium sp. CCI2.3]|uniref:hypothetical protein n=1 Tax=Actimicrobium sp. CCI2.3 TaxID=3048616 RepID=UPI002AB45ADD|nr:hypothetical protein [Actimicrobium sp. CCI2.3]MDY7575164.1 hypothetical protein [Actimicrobium sp. CCI2.3]MEB0023584.1 hypothetical protein [Actimicrobium sp. CCI2.3]